MKRVLVTGSDGQMGQSLRELASSYAEFEFNFCNRSQLDITDHFSVQRKISEYQPHFVINFAAYTAVDRAEEDLETAQLINETGAKNLAVYCSEFDSVLIHLSTDYVYHNNINRPISEEDPCTPKTIYGKTKREGEQLIFNQLEKAIILRCSWIYGPYGHNFLKTMLRLMPNKDQLTIVQDQIGTPGYSLDLAQTIIDIMKHPIKKADFGIYNLTNSGVASWFDFAYSIKSNKNFDLELHPILSRDYPTPAQRPHYSVMNQSKIFDHFEIKLRPWQEALKECIAIIGDKIDQK